MTPEQKLRRARARRLYEAAFDAAWKAAQEGTGAPVSLDGACCGVADDPGTSSDVTFDLFKTGQGWSGILRVPMNAPGKALLMRTSPSPTKGKAENKTLRMARNIATSPIVKAALPPQAQLAMRALQSPIAKGALKSISKLF